MSGVAGFLAGRPKATNIGGFKVQTSAAGVPIPIVYGIARVAGNLIHMPKTPTPTKGGSKASSSKGANAGQTFYAPMIIALSEGPIAGIGHVWRDKDGILTYTGNYDVQGWSTVLGTSSQAAWSYLTTNYPSQAVPYQFTAYVDNQNVPLPNDSMSSYSWEVQGFLPFEGSFSGWPIGIFDASPAAIVPDLLESTQYGLGWSSARIGVLTSWQNYCAAFSTFTSPVIDTQTAARDILQEQLEISNTGAVWYDGVLHFIPYGDTAATANGHTYTPNTTPAYDLTDNDYLASPDEDPVVVTRKDPATAYNQVVVEYQPRANGQDYNTTSYTATDQFAVQTYGAIPLPTLTLHSIRSDQLAQQVAQVRLQREQNIRNTYTFKLGWRFSLLTPMDLVTLTDVGLGLNQTVVRLTEVEELADEQGIQVTAEEWPFGTASATLYTTPSGSGTSPNANVDPGNTNTPVIVEAPTQVALSPMDLLIGASGGTNWGGCDVYLSTDNVNFTKVGTITGPAVIGTLTATLNNAGAAYPSVDSTDTCSIDITASGRTLSSYSATDFANLVSLCYVQGASASTPEWIAFETATLTSTGHYNLTTMYRGLYQSTFASHASGKLFMLIDSAVARIPWPQGAAGQTVYFKLPAFNVYGAALQDVSTVSAFSYVIGGNPVPFQEAIPQSAGVVDADGNYKITVNLPKNAGSCKYIVSTSGFPSVASVVAGGTLFTGSPPLTLTLTGTLTFGQTASVTVVPFSGPSASGTQLTAINAQAAYLTFTATKTVFFAAGSFGPATNGQVYSYNNGALENDGAASTPFDWNASYQIPQGCTLTGASNHCYSNAARGAGHQATVALTIFSLDNSGGAPTGIAVMGASAIGWQDAASGVLSVSTTSLKILMNVRMRYVDAASDGLFGWAALTYAMPDPKQAL